MRRLGTIALLLPAMLLFGIRLCVAAGAPVPA